MEMKKIPVLPLSRLSAYRHFITQFFGIDELQLQENAGRAVAALVRELYGPLSSMKIAVGIGLDFKAGVALVASRFLENWGASISLLLVGRPTLRSSEKQLEIVKKMIDDINVIRWPSLNSYDLVIDGIVGFSLKNEPSGRVKSLIDHFKSIKRNILAIEVPSAINVCNGLPFGDMVVKARETIALGVPKESLFLDQTKHYVGDVYLADIGLPQRLYEKLGLDMPRLFGESEVIRLHEASKKIT